MNSTTKIEMRLLAYLNAGGGNYWASTEELAQMLTLRIEGLRPVLFELAVNRKSRVIAKHSTAEQWRITQNGGTRLHQLVEEAEKELSND